MSSRIHLYRPHRTNSEDLEAIVVGREPVLREILERLRRWEPGTTRQHYLIIGPRGIGKTYLLRLVEHRIRQSAELRKKWYPISFPEESFRVTKVSDLLINMLRILSEETQAADIQKMYEQARYDQDEARVVDLSLDTLRSFSQMMGRGILLMVENVNRMFEKQIKHRSEIHLLRKILIEEEWLWIICTSPTYLNAVTQPEEPLFEFFQVQRLKELSPDEQQQMLYKLAVFYKNTRFEAYLRQFQSRFQALYHFTGGSPRLTVMMYDLVANQNIRDVQIELDSLLDQITPFYQGRMGDISEQEGMLLEAMSLLSEGCSPTELAKEVRLPGENVRALLSRLEKGGYVHREKRRQKKTVYIISERFFRIWHQMNNSRQAHGRVQYLLEFFTSWYSTREERDQIWRELQTEFQHGLKRGDGERVEDIAEYMKYVAEISEGRERFEREFDRLRQLVSSSEYQVDQAFAELDLRHQEDGDYFVSKGYFLAHDLDHHEAALSAFQRAVELKPGDIIPYFNVAVALDKLGRSEEARNAYRQAKDYLYSQRTRAQTESEDQNVLLEVLREGTDSSLVRIAAYLIGRSKSLVVIPTLSSIIQTAKLATRRQHCATALGLLGSEDAISVLCEALPDREPIVRGSAATALGHIGSERAVEPLIGCLQDTGSNVRGSAATALGRIGSERAVEPLIVCLQDTGSNVRGSAAAALGRIGSERAVEPLIPCLQDSEGNVRSSTIFALGKICSEQSLPELGIVFAEVLNQMKEQPREQAVPIAQVLLRAAFRTAHLEMIQHSLNCVRDHFVDAELICRPYQVALEYLRSDRDPAIMERQHPEMREAVQILVETFDKGRLHATSPLAPSSLAYTSHIEV